MYGYQDITSPRGGGGINWETGTNELIYKIEVESWR